MSHSKRNTTRPVFTSHERNLAKSNWAAKSARLNRDSFLPFGFCGLCLEIARDPVSCQRGDIFCRECALSNMLAQKKDMKRSEKVRKHAELESTRARAADEEEDQRRAVRDFELTQAGLLGGGSSRNATRPSEKAEIQDNTLRITGAKRKFELDADELERIAKEDRTRARKAIDDEKAGKASLPSFWTPSLTPDATKDAKLIEASKKVKPVAICPASASDSPHALTMQHLITIKFDEEADPSKPAKTRICPSCRKTLTNSSSPAMGMKCGHVLCLSCIKQFMAPPKQSAKGEIEEERDITPLMCFVCDTALAFVSDAGAAKTSLPSGMIALKSEGTGFSARGGSTVERNNVAFQC